jgi:hypothetical protein
MTASSVDGDVEAAFVSSRELFSELIGDLYSTGAGEWTAAQLEDHLTSKGRELLRCMFQDHVDLRAVREQRSDLVVAADGTVQGTVETGHRRVLATVFGEVAVERFAYRRQGQSNLHPADAVLNLPVEKYSHGLRRHAAIESARGSFDDAVAAIKRTCGTHIGKRQVQELAERSTIDFDEFYAARSAPPGVHGDVLVLSADGKGIVMRPEALRGATAATAANATGTAGGPTQVRANLSSRRNRKRMAEVGAVYDITPGPRQPTDIMRRPDDTRPPPDGPKLHSKWVVASVTDDIATVIGEVFAEADRRDPNRTRQWIALVDGNNHQIDRIQTEATNRGINVSVVVDFIHVLEYAWDAARCFYHEGDPAAAGWVHERAHEILEGHATKVAANIRTRAAPLKPDQRTGADTCADYLTNKAPYLDYPTALTAGWPIATGVIEGACRHLVKDRMDITGARWGLDGAEAILKLRALLINGDFDAYWTFHLAQEHQRTHRARYLHNLIPVSEQQLL